MSTRPPTQVPLVSHRHIRQAVLCRHRPCVMPFLLPFAARFCVSACSSSCFGHTQSFGLPPAILPCLPHTVFSPAHCPFAGGHCAVFRAVPARFLLRYVAFCFACAWNHQRSTAHFVSPAQRSFLPAVPDSSDAPWHSSSALRGTSSPALP